MSEVEKSKESLESQENDLNNAEEKPKELDEEGLRKDGYDVVLCGTGLTQSILAAALARAGKQVLHCDSNDFYGDMDAVLSLGSLIDWASTISANGESSDIDKQDQPISDNGDIPLQAAESSSVRIDSILNPSERGVHELKEGMTVMTPYGQGRLLMDAVKNGAKSSAVELKDWIMADGKSPIAYIGSQQLDAEDESEIVPLDVFMYEKYIKPQQRSFALDLSPSLLYADGEAVDGMINSGVSEYCEFKSIIGLNLFMKNAQKTIGSRINKGEETKATLSRVPCSKRDVFQSKLLSPMDKRRLMKFLQIASDYATSLASTRVTEPSTITQDDNDNHEDVGKAEIENDVVTSLNERQLQQGRSLYRPQNKAVSTTDLETLEKCIKDGMPFDTYLKVHHKLSDHMKKVVIYAMAMGSNYDDVAQYSTEAGMNDLCKHLQSLGKFGETAFLFPMYGSGELPQAFCRSAAVHGATYLLRRGPKSLKIDEVSGKARGVVVSGFSYDQAEEIPTKFIPSANVVLPAQMLQKNTRNASSSLRVFRRISILKGALVKSEEANVSLGREQRHVIIIPPDDDVILNQSVIHGIALDESVNISPRAMKSFHITILYLSTISKDNSGKNVLDKAVQSLCKGECMELFHLNFSYEQKYDKKELGAGVHVCHPHVSLTAEASFVEAKRIFESICPGDEFLSLSTYMDNLVKESLVGLGHDEDDEVKMLESAMNMIATRTSDTVKEEAQKEKMVHS